MFYLGNTLAMYRLTSLIYTKILLYPFTSYSILDFSLATPGITAEQGVFTFYGSAEINAQPDEVWRVISNFQTYPEWNEYTPSITQTDGAELTSPPRAEEWYTLHYKLDTTDNAKAMKMKLISFDNETKSLSWQGHFMPTFLLRAEKVQKVTKIEDQDGKGIRTKYEIWETQAGPLAHVVKLTMKSKLQKMNEGIAANLKTFIERSHNS